MPEILRNRKIIFPRLSVIALIIGGFLLWSSLPANSDPTSKSNIQNRTTNYQSSPAQKSEISFSLIKNTPEARNGNVSIDQNEEGISIAGTVSGGVPEWSQTADEMAGKDHLEIWLADGNPTELPPVGWGNQFGYEQLNSEADCGRRTSTYVNISNAQLLEECRQWYRKQIKYRESFEKLFIRQWQIAPNVIKEIYASPVFESFDQAIREKLSSLRITGLPQAKFQTVDPGGYRFEILIPWEAFPPVRSLQLKNLRILVDVFNPGRGNHQYGPFSTISKDRKDGHPNSFVLFSLPVPRVYSLTTCRYDSENVVIYTGPKRDSLGSSKQSKKYYFPTNGSEVDKLIVLDNEAAGYQYEPKPESKSPIALTASYWTKDIGNNEILCGPWLAYLKNGKVSKTDFVIDSKDNLEVRNLSTGDVLIKEGPRVWWSYYGSGQCGACPRVSLNIFYLNRTGNLLSQAFDYLGIADPGSSDIDIALSPDWNTINIFESKTEYTEDSEKTTWGQTTFCFKSEKQKYEKCGKKSQVQEPSPRSIDAAPFYR